MIESTPADASVPMSDLDTLPFKEEEIGIDNERWYDALRED